MVAGEQATSLRRQGERQSRVAKYLRWVGQFIRSQPLGAVGATTIIVLLLIGIFADVIAPYRFDEFSVPDRLNSPSLDHPFGTDEQGRDVFSRTLFGARTTVIIGFGAVAVSILIASVLGAVSGYFGGTLDILIQRIVDIWLAFPGLVFVIFIIAIVSRSTLSLVLTLGVLIAAGSSRIVRSSTITVKEASYIEASRSIGANEARILLRHVLPNVVPIIIISASVQIGNVILIESSLSFLGFGVPPPFPSWGRMLQEAQLNGLEHPYLALFPGIAISLVVFSFNMFGDALRDILDPRLRGSR